jgi:hypothetical protein
MLCAGPNEVSIAFEVERATQQRPSDAKLQQRVKTPEAETMHSKTPSGDAQGLDAFTHVSYRSVWASRGKTYGMASRGGCLRCDKSCSRTENSVIGF